MAKQNRNSRKGRLRGLSFNEKLYTLGEKTFPSFAIQFVLKGEGIIDEIILRNSLHRLIELIPALQLQIKGKYWVYGNHGPKLIIHPRDFDGNLNASYFNTPMDATIGQTCEIHTFQGISTTIVVRVLHSLMDGVGLLTMLDTWFDIINEKTPDSIIEFPSDEEFRASLKVQAEDKRSGYSFKWKAVQEFRDKKFEYTNSNIALEGKVVDLIGKLAKWYTLQTRQSGLFLIPVNVRRHNPAINSVANLSFPIYLEAKLDESEDEIHSKLLRELSKNNELAKDTLEVFGKAMPSLILKGLILYKVKKAQIKNAFPMSGFLSDLGFVDLSRLSTSSFTCTDLIPIPIHVPLAPFCVLSCHHTGGTRVGLSIPKKIPLSDFEASLSSYLMVDNKVGVSNSPRELSELGRSIRAIWAEILNMPEEAIESNASYSSLGGSSLNLLLLIDKVESEIIRYEKKELMAHVIVHGGNLTIAKMEEIIQNTIA